MKPVEATGQGTGPRYVVRQVAGPDDLDRVLRLRADVFRGTSQAEDRDALDDLCDHYLIVRAQDDHLVGSFRVLILVDGSALDQSYAAQFYDLSALADFEGPMVELGRFCVRPGLRDPDILRAAWAELTRLVDGRGVRLLFGCSSFQGVEAAMHRDAFALLNARHIAPNNRHG